MSSQTPRKPWWRRWFGTRSERAAARFLQSLGYRILARNFTCVHGEIDVVAVDVGTVVFVEIRSSETDSSEKPAASVDYAKQKRLTNLALHYLQMHRLLDRAARFDVLIVTWPAGHKEPAIQHIPSAFEAVGRFQMMS